MKNKIIFTSFLFITSLISNAQDMDFGIKGGLNLANINGDSQNVGIRTSFHAGVAVEVKFSDRFSFQPEVLFSEQGSETNITERVGTETIKYKSVLRLDYINIPLLAKYYLTDGFAIEMGPNVGMLLSARNQETLNGALRGEEIISDDFNKIDLGFGVGLGYKFEFGGFIQARYNLGLSNLYKDSDDFKDVNTLIQISVGYFL